MSVVTDTAEVIPTRRGAGNPRWFIRVLPETYHMVDRHKRVVTTFRRTARRRGAEGV